MTLFNLTQTPELKRIWLQTPDRRNPLRAVWVVANPMTKAAPAYLLAGGASRCT